MDRRLRKPRPRRKARQRVRASRAAGRRTPAVPKGPDDGVQVTLRVFGADLDPDEVTRLLGAAPTEAARTGTVLIGPDGQPRNVRKGYWRLDAAPGPGTVEDQVEALLGALTQDPAAWRELASRYEPDLLCGLFLEGFNQVSSLPPALVRALADRGLAIRFDIYAL
ncbi:MAG: DUF4279 domain-containing protein [Holophaga sp.]